MSVFRGFLEWLRRRERAVAVLERLEAGPFVAYPGRGELRATLKIIARGGDTYDFPTDLYLEMAAAIADGDLEAADVLCDRERRARELRDGPRRLELERARWFANYGADGSAPLH